MWQTIFSIQEVINGIPDECKKTHQSHFTMIEVFKTNVQNKTQARQVVAMLKKVFSDANINFDLADCDKILRVNGIKKAHAQTIVTDLNKIGFKCEILH